MAAAFAGVFAILPASQYFLVINRLTAPASEQGQVAGVRTEGVTVRASLPQEPACDGQKAALLADYEKTVAPYKAAIPVLQGSPENIQSETEALNRLISDEYQSYLKKAALLQESCSAD